MLISINNNNLISLLQSVRLYCQDNYIIIQMNNYEYLLQFENSDISKYHYNGIYDRLTTNVRCYQSPENIPHNIIDKVNIITRPISFDTLSTKKADE